MCDSVTKMYKIIIKRCIKIQLKVLKVDISIFKTVPIIRVNVKQDLLTYMKKLTYGEN